MTRALLCFLLTIPAHLGLFGQDLPQFTDSLVTEAEDVSGDLDANAPRLVAPDELESTQTYKTEVLRFTDFDEEEWRAIVAGKNFEEELKPKAEKSSPWSGPWLRLISYTVIIGVILLLVYYVIRYISFDLKIKRSKLVTDDIEKPVEDIAVVDTRALLEQAKRDRNYKLAIRLYYLGLLKQLDASGVIKWKKDKTNRDYLMELFSANFYFDEIRRLTTSYEAVWYGDHMLQEKSFELLSDKFETIYSKLNEGAAA